MPNPVILFDGVCNLCNGVVDWVIRRDKNSVFRFASLQSDVAKEVLASVGAAPATDSIVLLDEAGVHTRADAALRIAARLGRPWSMLRIGYAFPPVVRNAVYDFVARNRYRWFGKSDSCRVPTPEESARFL